MIAPINATGNEYRRGRETPGEMAMPEPNSTVAFKGRSMGSNPIWGHNQKEAAYVGKPSAINTYDFEVIRATGRMVNGWFAPKLGRSLPVTTGGMTLIAAPCGVEGYAGTDKQTSDVCMSGEVQSVRTTYASRNRLQAGTQARPRSRV